MKLSELLVNSEVVTLYGEENVEVSSLYIDTRKDFKEGGLFFAYKGTGFDGHDFIGQALDKGAQVVVCEHLPEDIRDGVTYVQAKNSQAEVGRISSLFYGEPSKKMKVIGVTGTNGKTSIATSLYQALTISGYTTGLISTVENIIADKKYPTEHTTPNALEIQRMMSEMLSENCTHVAMEVSSHALDQKRVEAIDFDIAIFTNLTQEHLDYHGSMEEYAKSKQQLFAMLKPEALALVNADSDYATMMVEQSQARVLSFGKNENSDYDISDIQQSSEGQSYNINGSAISIKQLGDFNVSNMTAVYGALVELGIDDKDAASVLAQSNGAKGRLQLVPNNKGITAIVDYAHTPDALENVLETLQKIPHRKIITIFGCGGDRDRSKRPQMAKIAEKLSDIVVVTSDNPRTEDPIQIFADIEEGFTKSSSGHAVIEDREEAIRRTIMIAQEGDILLVAGKGHEDYQIIGTEKTHFDDVEVLSTYLL